MSSTDDPAHFPNRGGGEVDWGLALSGGGMRAASFSIGVLKALYDDHLLDEIDVISSVSGGGFASYWLLTNYDKDQKQRYGYAVLRDDVFLKNVCDLQGTADFIPKHAIFKAFRANDEAVAYYQGRIRRSFGKAATGNEDLTFLRDSIQRGDAPYFVFGAALKKSEDYKDLVEITPEYTGNHDLHFAKWGSSGTKAWTLVESVAISGAAIPPKLRRIMPSYPELDLHGKEFGLIDGGFVENLAAIPLIRRGIRNIIVVDSEADKHYKFKEYKKLKKLLAAMKIDFCVPGIESFLSKRDGPYTRAAVNIGLATSSGSTDGLPIMSTIYYIKLSRPSTIVTRNENDPAYKRGNALAGVRDSDIAGSLPDTFRCEKAPPLAPADAHDLFFYLVNKYDIAREARVVKWWRFPQLPTADENLERSTMESLIGLGYLEGSELKPK